MNGKPKFYFLKRFAFLMKTVRELTIVASLKFLKSSQDDMIMALVEAAELARGRLRQIIRKL